VQTYSQNTENAPVEETELNYPVRIARYELVPDSGGAGQYRGGLGLRRDYVFPGHEPTFTILADRLKFPPQGLFGGEPGQLAYYGLIDAGGGERPLGSKVTFTVPEGCAVTMQTCGGGGYGPAAEREPERVLQDVVEGKVSLERAREVYKVAIDLPGRAVDRAATSELRGNGRATR
jgi:N-methylhydantoinase B